MNTNALKKLLSVAIFTTGTATAASPTTTTHSVIKAAPNSILNSQKIFFERLASLCGNAYIGKITVDNQKSDSFANKKLVMHIRKCHENELQIPFHVGKDASRTWIFKKTDSGLTLKHDHRLASGDYDPLTMYGGHTISGGTKEQQAFPADAYSKEMFKKQGLLSAIGNTWKVTVADTIYTYQLTRKNRDFQVEFDLTKPITPPKAPWGYSD